MARYVNLTANIAAGQALSNAIDCSAGAPVFLHMPSDWTPARLSFQVSADGTNFNDLFDAEAHELTVNVLPATSVRIDATLWAPITQVKLRSGARNTPVPQQADRAVIITIDTAAV